MPVDGMSNLKASRKSGSAFISERVPCRGMRRTVPSLNSILGMIQQPVASRSVVWVVQRAEAVHRKEAGVRPCRRRPGAPFQEARRAYLRPFRLHGSSPLCPRQVNLKITTSSATAIPTCSTRLSVTGPLALASNQRRSRSAQAAAGGSDRLTTDDGGHYIAAPFNGPTDTFNHFAQDANFNRGGYRVLEDRWAQDIKAGKQVYVSITPRYDGSTRWPATIHVVFSVNGQRSLRDFPNISKGTSHGK
jgi:hypothetical protein